MNADQYHFSDPIETPMSGLMLLFRWLPLITVLALTAGVAVSHAEVAEPAISMSAVYEIEGHPLTIETTWKRLDESDLQAVDAMADLQEKMSADGEIAPILFFTTDEKAARSPSSEGQTEKSRSLLGRFQDAFRKKGTVIEIHSFPELSKDSPETESPGRTLSRRFSKEELFYGISLAVYRGQKTFVTCIAGGTSLGVAVGMSGFQTSMALVSFFKRDWFDRMYAYNIKEPGKPVHFLTRASRRQLYNLAYEQLRRALNGPMGNAVTIASWEGQSQVWTYIAILGIPDTVFSSLKADAFRGASKLNNRFSFYTNLLFIPLFIREGANMGHTILDLKYYTITDNTLEIIATYATLSLALKFAPAKIRTLVSPETYKPYLDKIRHLVGSVKGLDLLATKCRGVLSKEPVRSSPPQKPDSEPGKPESGGIFDAPGPQSWLFDRQHPYMAYFTGHFNRGTGSAIFQ